MKGRWKIAKIVKPLAGIIAMVEAGNRVTFDQTDSGVNMSSIYNKRAKKFIPINKIGRGYAFDMWIPVGKQDQTALNAVEKGVREIEVKNRFEGFLRQV